MKDVISAGLLKYEFRVIDTSGNKIFIDSVNRVSGVSLDLLNDKGDLMYLSLTG